MLIRILMLIVALGLGACAGGKAQPITTPWDLAMDDTRTGQRRVKAMREAWNGGDKGDADQLKLGALFWSKQTPRDVRLGVLTVLDEDPEGKQPLHDILRDALPHETDGFVAERCAELAMKHQWRDLTPQLVRSMSRGFQGMADHDRPEARALLALNPGKELVDIALSVVAQAEENLASTPEQRRISRMPMLDAWNVTMRLDPYGDRRRAWLEDPAHARFLNGSTRRAAKELGILAATGEELLWIEQLLAQDSRGESWWRETGSAVASLTDAQKHGLEIRHLEPLRWAAKNRPEWSAATASELRDIIERRLRGRQIHVRSIDMIQTDGPNRERLSDWADRMSWGDLLTLLVADEAMGSDSVQRKLPDFVRLDREDTSTEYGGVIVTRADGTFDAVLYPPRPAERLGDNQFVASVDMLEQQPTCLAHFHLHVQPRTGSPSAGPSRGDLVQVARSGRTGIVLTSVTSSVLDVDLYQPDAAVIDLGEVRIAK